MDTKEIVYVRIDSIRVGHESLVDFCESGRHLSGYIKRRQFLGCMKKFECLRDFVP